MKEKIAKPKKFQQNTEVKQHYHPRNLARAIVHNAWAMAGAAGMNQVKPGTTQSPFSAHWRGEADMIAREEGTDVRTTHKKNRKNHR